MRDEPSRAPPVPMHNPMHRHPHTRTRHTWNQHYARAVCRDHTADRSLSMSHASSVRSEAVLDDHEVHAAFLRRYPQLNPHDVPLVTRTGNGFMEVKT